MKDRMMLLAKIGILVVMTVSSPAGAEGALFSVGELRGALEISWTTPMSYERATLVVVDAEGEVARRVFGAAEPLSYDLLDSSGKPLQDGVYSYQIRIRRALDLSERRALEAARTVKEGESPEVVQRNLERARSAITAASGPLVIRRSGRFRLQGGRLESAGSAAVPPDEGHRAETISEKAAEHISTNETIAGNLCVGSAECDSAYDPVDDLEVIDTMPSVVWATCTPPSSSCLDWWQVQVDGDLFVEDRKSDTVPMTIEQGTPTDALHVGPGAKIGVGTVPSDEVHLASDSPTLLLEDTDDMTTASFSLNNRATKILADAVEIRAGDPMTGPFVQVDADGVGVGAAPTPEAELLVYGEDPGGTALRLFNGGDLIEHFADIEVAWPDMTFGYDPLNTGIRPIRLDLQAPESSLVLDALGRLGLGAATPEAALHLQRDDGTARLLVREQSATTTGRTLLKLDNNGYPRLVLQDSSLGTQWVAASVGGGAFTFNRVGSGIVEMKLFPGGDMTIGGSLTEGSSRKIKRDFESVDTEAVLQKVLELPLARWSYKASERGERHLGPMAEDFHGTFGLGEGTGIAALDGSGVALAAIQGLDHTIDRRLEERNDEIAALRARNEELERRLAALEKLAVERLKACGLGTGEAPETDTSGERHDAGGGR